jgi:hypothetical protein
MRESIIFYTVIVLGIVAAVLGIYDLTQTGLLLGLAFAIPLIVLGIGLSLLGLAVKKVVDTAKALLTPKK